MELSFLDIIIGIAVVAIGAAGAYAITTFASYIKSKKVELESFICTNEVVANNDQVKNALETLSTIVDNVVNALNTTYKKELLSVTSDGKLTKEDGKLLRDKAVELVIAEVADPMKILLSDTIGNLSEYVKTLIENSVEKAKKKTKTSAKASSTKKTTQTETSAK